MNQFPTTSKQLELYSELNKNSVKYALIGALAARFYGRNRSTKDIDLLVDHSVRNCMSVKKSLLNLGYPAHQMEGHDFQEYEYIRIGGKALLDLHASYLGSKYEDIGITFFEHKGVKVPVADKSSLISMMKRTGVSSEDVRILELLDDPIANAEEINNSQ